MLFTVLACVWVGHLTHKVKVSINIVKEGERLIEPQSIIFLDNTRGISPKKKKILGNICWGFSEIFKNENF